MSTAAQPAYVVGITESPERQHYSKAPIVEAIIDVRLTPASDFKLDDLRAAASSLSASFPHLDETYVVQAAANFDGGAVTASADQKLGGFRIRDDDGKRAAHFDIHRFAFSKYYPYDCWETFRDAAREAWERYVGAVRPTLIQRLSLRYVNRIDIPLPAGDLREWLLTVPDVNPAIGPGVSSYLMELHVPQVDLPRTSVVMRQGLIAPERPDAISIVLDIDVVRGVELPGDDDGSALVWQMLETIHTRENQVFERTITDRVRERIR